MSHCIKNASSVVHNLTRNFQQFRNTVPKDVKTKWLGSEQKRPGRLGVKKEAITGALTLACS
jgi:hypothetical protein